MPKIMLDAVAYEAEEGLWVAQCLQIDIGAQAPTLEDLDYELQRSLVGHLAICREHGLAPFHGLHPAPAKYWEMWMEAQEEYSPDHEAFDVLPGQLAAEPRLRIATRLHA